MSDPYADFGENHKWTSDVDTGDAVCECGARIASDAILSGSTYDQLVTIGLCRIQQVRRRLQDPKSSDADPPPLHPNCRCILMVDDED